MGFHRMVTRGIVGLLFLLIPVYSNPVHNKLLAEEYRLPGSVVPTKYTIALTFPETLFAQDGIDFKGTVTIDFTVNSTIKEIKLHLTKDYITVTNLTVNDAEVQPKDYTIDSTTEIITIPSTIEPEDGKSNQLVITYDGKISTKDNYGIYKSSSINAKKEAVFLLATHFQPTYARRVFPCFDEPSFKATYDVTITYPSTKNLAVLFNTEKTKEPEPDELAKTFTVSFKTTPIMSSYLVALTVSDVSDFTSTTGASVNGDPTVSLTVWSRDALAPSRDYAKEVGPKILEKLNEYTGRLYSKDATKIDLVALPDLPVGAMENWGLVTFRENALLWNPDESLSSSKQNIATLIAHELAHQWFGNLITCNWWSETFLNEGFATYFATAIAHEVEPTWELDKQFVLGDLQVILETDALVDAQALKSIVNSPSEVMSTFGPIPYKKGGSVLRMLTYIMGEENFKAGIKEYFTTAEYLHATTDYKKLLAILEKQVKTEISALPKDTTLTTVMQDWIEKPGYPLLTVSLEGKILKISQERFLSTGTETEKTTWYVPITYAESLGADKQDTKPKTWLTPEAELSWPLDNENTWVLLNPLQTGYYRVKYDSKLLANIAAALQKENFDGIAELNRAHLVDDLFSLAEASKLSYEEVFSTIEFLKNDDSYYSWVPAFKGFSFIMEKLPESAELRPLVVEQLSKLMDRLYKSTPFDTTKETDQIYTLKQRLASTWACTLGVEDCVTKSKAAFAEYKTGKEPNKLLKGIVICNGLRNSENVNDYEYVWDKYTTTESLIEKNTLLNGLGCFDNEEKLKGLLTEAINDNSKIGAQDTLTAFVTVYGGSQHGIDVALDFIGANLPAVFKKIPSTGSKKSLITGIAGKLTSDAQVNKLQALIATTDFPAELKDDSEKAVLKAQSNIKWIAGHQAELEEFYKGKTPTIPSTTIPPTTIPPTTIPPTTIPPTTLDPTTIPPTTIPPTTIDPTNKPGGGGASAICIDVGLLALISIFSILGLY